MNITKLSNQRIDFVDFAKGLCIILVVIYHVCEHMHIKSDVLYAVGTFRMPLYFFLSGLFFKKYNNFRGFIIRKTNNLLIPFVFFYLFTAVLLPNLFSVIGIYVNQNSIGLSSLWAFIDKETFENRPIWFLWCLYVMNIQFYLYHHIAFIFPRYKMAVLVLICLIVGALGVSFSMNKIDLPAFIDTSFSSIPFFCIGYISNRFLFCLQTKKWDNYLFLMALLCFLITFLFAGRVNYVKNQFYINPLSVYLCGTLGTYGVLFLSKTLHKLPLVSYWGRYSIMILVTHGLVIRFYSSFLHKISIHFVLIAIIVIVATMLSYQLLIPLMKKYLPYVTAQKHLIEYKN